MNFGMELDSIFWNGLPPWDAPGEGEPGPTMGQPPGAPSSLGGRQEKQGGEMGEGGPWGSPLGGKMVSEQSLPQPREREGLVRQPL